MLITEDVLNNSEVLKKMIICSKRTFKNQRFQGKYRHSLILHGLFVSRIDLSLHIFGKCVS